MRTGRSVYLLLLIVAMALMALSATRAWREVRAVTGIEVEAEVQGGVEVARVAEGSPADAAGVRAGDRLVAIGGQPVRSTLVAQDRLAGLRPDARVGLRLLRDGQVVTVRLQPERQAQWFKVRVLAGLVGWMFALGGLAVSLRPRGSRADASYALCCLAGALVLGVSWSSHAAAVDWVLFWADRAARLLLPALWIQLALDVAAAGRRIRRWLPLAYAPAVALLLAEAHLVGLGGALRADDPVGLVELVQSRVELGWLAVGVVVGLGLLVFAGRTGEHPAVRAQRRWMIAGAAVGTLPLVLVSALPRMLSGAEPAWSWIAIPWLAIVPLTFTGAVLEYRLMDLALFARRGLAALAMIAMSFVIFVGLWTLAKLLVPLVLHPAQYVPLLLAAAVTVMLAPGVRAASQDLVGRLYYRRRYNFRRALARVARDLNAERHLPRLRDVLERRVAEALDADPVTLLLVDASGTMRDPVSQEVSGSLPAPTRRRLEEGNTVALADVVDAPRTLRELHAAGVQILSPLRVEGRIIAVLAVGRRRVGGLLDSDDVDLIRSVAAHAAAAVAGALNLHRLEEQVSLVERLRAQTGAIIESSPIGLAMVDAAHQVREWNSAIEQLVGATREEARGRHFGQVLPGPIAGALRDAIASRASSRRAFRVRVAGSGDDERLVNLTITAMSQPEEDRAWLLTVDDVTARVRLEEQLIQQDRLASVGLLAAGVAHEVNTPLTGISSYAQFLLEETPDEDPKHSLLEKIVSQADRASKIARGLLGISRPNGDGSAAEAVDLGELAEETIGFLGPRIRRCEATVVVSRDALDVIALGDRSRLQQVLINLLLNALDAVEPGGRVVVSSAWDGNGLARLDVTDDGAGIPREVVRRIFDPFFTTKAAGEGTGLGLSISYSIVREHGGTLSVDSEPGRGTRMTIRLPAAVEAGTSRRAVG
jgi:hypothetical protein